MKKVEVRHTKVAGLSKGRDAFYLKPIEVRVESVFTLNVCNQTHGQLFVILVSDVHHGGDVQRQTIYSCKSETEMSTKQSVISHNEMQACFYERQMEGQRIEGIPGTL